MSICYDNRSIKLTLSSETDNNPDDVGADPDDVGADDVAADDVADPKCGRSYIVDDPDSGCFLEVAGACTVANRACLDLQCNPTNMKITARADVFGEGFNKIDANKMLVNSKTNCVSITTTEANGLETYDLELNYGACDMTQVAEQGM